MTRTVAVALAAAYAAPVAVLIAYALINQDNASTITNERTNNEHTRPKHR